MIFLPLKNNLESRVNGTEIMWTDLKYNKYIEIDRRLEVSFV